MNTKTTHVRRITLAVALLAALALLLPFLGMVALALLTLVLPLLLVLTPVLVLLPVVFLVRARGKHEPTGGTRANPVSMGGPALPAPAP